MISKDTIQALIGEWNLISGPEAHRDKFYCEIENWSPLGEDLVETVWFDGTLDGFIQGLFEFYYNFDSDEHAAMYVNIRGKNGVPESVIDLAMDALDIEKMLESLWEEAKEKIMTTYQMVRCKDCGYLVEGEEGSWICTDWEKEIHEVDNDDCALEAEI